MPRLSFRFKLLVAMMLVVAGVSVVTLWLTQIRVQAAYEKLFEEKLRDQLTHVPREQEERIGEIKRECARFAGLRRIFAALEERDVEQLYLTAQDELRVILGREETSTNAGSESLRRHWPRRRRRSRSRSSPAAPWKCAIPRLGKSPAGSQRPKSPVPRARRFSASSTPMEKCSKRRNSADS